MIKLKPVIGILLIFACGVLAGTLGTRLYFKHRFEQLPEPLSYHKQVALKRMGNSLNLTPAQAQAIAAIMEESERRIFQIMAPHAREIDLLMLNTRNRIMAELDQRQQRQFADDLRRIRKQREPHMRMHFKMELMNPRPHGVPPLPRAFEEGPPSGMHRQPPQER